MINQTTLHEVFDAYADDLLAISYSYVKNWQTAEDLVQDVFFTYWQKKDAFRGDSSLKTYLTRMIINRCKDYLKSWKYKAHILTNEFVASFKQKKSLIEKEERTFIGNSVLSLPVPYREVIVLYFYKEHTYREISELLNVSETTVRNRLAKGKAQLRKKFEHEKWEVVLHDELEG